MSPVSLYEIPIAFRALVFPRSAFPIVVAADRVQVQREIREHPQRLIALGGPHEHLTRLLGEAESRPILARELRSVRGERGARIAELRGPATQRKRGGP